MCGLVGIVGNIDGKAEKAFKHMLILDSLRGEDSTGVLSVAKHQDGQEMVAKQVGDPFMLFDHKSYDKTVSHRSSRVLLGHNRYATTGGVNRQNAHPFEFPSVIGMHNGTLTNKHYFDRDNKFNVDSEALYNCIDLFGIDEAVKHAKGAWALTWWDKDARTINYCRNKERPLFYALDTKEEMLFHASERWMITIAASRNGIDLGEVHELAEDVLFSIPIPVGGKLGKPVVRALERAPEPVAKVHTGNFPKGAKNHSGSTSRTSLIPVATEAAYGGSKMDMSFISAHNVTMEAVDMMKDKHGAEYMLCFCPEKPFYEIRLYRSIHSQVYDHPGCEFVGSISSFTSVSSQGAGYYKVSPHGTHIQTFQVKGVAKEEYPTHDGKYLGRAEWKQMYGDCAFCNDNLEPEDLATGSCFLTSMGDGLCDQCAESAEVKPYVQLVNI